MSLVLFESCSRLAGLGCREAPDSASLSFASPKESKQRKGDPQSGALRATCEWGQKRGSAQTRLRLKQRAALIPLLPPFTGPARTGLSGTGKFGLPDSLPSSTAKVPSVCAEERRARRIRARDCLSEASSSGTPAGPSTAGCPQRSEGTQTVGSPFFCLLFFGEAKKSEALSGASRHPITAKGTDANPREARA